LPTYLPKESFLRLSKFAQGKVIELLTNPPEPPVAYVKRKKDFTAAGYRDHVHYRIAGILEQLAYDSDENMEDETVDNEGKKTDS